MRHFACAVFVLVTACGQSETPAATPAATATPTGPRHGKLNVTKCSPVGYGYSCTADIDGTPVTLEACVGADDKIGLTPKIQPPVTLAVDIENAPESAKYCGILVLPAGEHLRIVAVK
jgi:hypothetical protein